MIQYLYLIPLLPLIGFVINGLGWKAMPRKAAAVLASGVMLLSFLLSIGVFMEARTLAEPVVQHYFPFIHAGSLSIDFAFQIDQLSSLFLLIITGVGFLIHIYSAGYMGHDPGEVRFFAYLNLFVFSMLVLVLGANYLMMFIGWEGVGLCSYLLIGFWFKNQDYTAAGRKAFVMNRIGDLGFLVGMFLVLYHFGTLSYAEFFPKLGAPEDLTGMSTKNWIAICFFIGAIGKSAQIPLYTWLPDAMAGPTPVSALIHAATMVTAGIYMIARSSVLYNLAPMALQLVAVIGLATAIIAATIALKQYDIKKVLAYSTVSQLGLMFLALGCGAYTTAVFHVMTHAFFKALLFLGSGSVIHAMGGEQDMRAMGGLGKKMRVTQITMLIGCLAIAGIPGFSGFFSKDEIMAMAWGQSQMLYWGGMLVSVMTAFYMFRLYALTFAGKFRGTKEQETHLHESPASMTIPLVVLAVFSVIGGYVGLPAVFSEHHWLNEFLGTVVHNGAHGHPDHSTEWMLLGIASAVAIVFSVWGYMANRNPRFQNNTGLALVLENKWYVDELYDAVIARPLEMLSRFTDKVIERMGIDGIVNGVGRTVRWGADRLRLLQTGQLGTYLFVIVIGMAVLFAIGFFWYPF